MGRLALGKLDWKGCDLDADEMLIELYKNWH